jgi:hypothetical protein
LVCRVGISAAAREENMKHFASKDLAVAALSAFGLGLAALPAAGADTTCPPNLSGGTINGNLVVPNNSTCSLAGGETVTGNVTVGTGAALIANGVIIGGNVQANHCNFVRLALVADVSVGGNVTIESCTAASGYDIDNLLVRTTISGNFICANNSARCVAEFGSVGANVQVNNNTGGTSIVSHNSIAGNLSCHGNTGVAGGFNTVAGNKLGQCAGL